MTHLTIRRLHGLIASWKQKNIPVDTPVFFKLRKEGQPDYEEGYPYNLFLKEVAASDGESVLLCLSENPL